MAHTPEFEPGASTIDAQMAQSGKAPSPFFKRVIFLNNRQSLLWRDREDLAVSRMSGSKRPLRDNRNSLAYIANCSFRPPSAISDGAINDR
jgi:hypothetical protein